MQERTSGGISSGARRRRIFLCSLAALFVAAGAETAYRRWRSAAPEWGGARFVWADDATAGAARAFYLARDFVVPQGAALGSARLLVLADEEHVIYLNGLWIGGGRHRLGDPADRYDVSERVHEGPNRIVVEARSTTGIGGVLLALALDDSGAPLVVSDGSWTVFSQHVDGLVQGTARIRDGRPARVLGAPPLGRWRSPAIGPVRPAAPLRPPRSWAKTVTPLGATRARAPRKLWSVDFATTVEGTLDLGTDLGSCSCPLRYFVDADELVRFTAIAPARREPAPRALVQVPGAPRWRDVEPRRFRYVTVEAERPPLDASVLSGPAVARDRPPVGPFGLDPPSP